MLHLFAKFAAVALSAICLFNSASLQAQTTCDNSIGRSNNHLPQVRLTLEPILYNDFNAVFLLGEAGHRHYRINGTYGLNFCTDHFIKIGGEWLTEDLEYKFYSGRQRRWVSQAAGGAVYRYVLPFSCYSIISFNLSFDYSKANKQDLKSFDCSDLSTLQRRISGGQNGGGTLGFTALPWRGGEVTVALTYDCLRLNRKHQHDENLHGYGGAVAWKQRLWRNVNMKIIAEIRRPYEFYEAQFDFVNWTMGGDYTLGIFGNYTHGKKSLPNTIGYGIVLGADLGAQSCRTGCSRSSSCRPNEPCLSPVYDLASWAAVPAVYIPEVLAITDQIILLKTDIEE